MQIDVGVQQVDDAAEAPVDRELVLDRLGDVAVEEDSLAGQEEAAVGRDLVGLPPDPRLDLGLVVDLEPKLLVLGLELEAGAEAARQRLALPLGAGDVPRRVSRGGR